MNSKYRKAEVINMYCSNCGNELETGDIACPMCGNKSGESYKMTNSKLNRKMLVSVLVVAAVLFVLNYVGNSGPSGKYYELSMDGTKGTSYIDFKGGKMYSLDEPPIPMAYDYDKTSGRITVYINDIYNWEMIYDSKKKEIYFDGLIYKK